MIQFTTNRIQGQNQLRPSTVKDPDIILVTEDGRTPEQGAHDERLAAPGACTALGASRSTAPAVPDDAPDDAPEMQESTIHDTP